MESYPRQDLAFMKHSISSQLAVPQLMSRHLSIFPVSRLTSVEPLSTQCKERNHVDESVCHLRDSSFQISLGREGTVPVWVGMGWLETKSGDRSELLHFDPFPVEDRNLRKQKAL